MSQASPILNLILLIELVHQRYRQPIRAILNNTGQTEESWRALTAIAHQDPAQPLRSSEIAKLTNLLGPSLSRITVRLENQGYIKSTVDEGDCRAVTFALTAKGRKLHDKLHREITAAYTAAFAFDEAAMKSAQELTGALHNVLKHAE